MEQIKDALKNIVTCLSSQTTNIANANRDDMMCATDMIKDLATAHYYCSITEAMENPENQYGRDYNENGRIKKGYTPNMNMRRGYNNNANGHMYDDMEYDSNYDRARRGYEETKDIESLGRIFDVIEDDMRELKPHMTMADKTTAHQRLMSLANMVNV